jgi:hypothetical protein
MANSPVQAQIAINHAPAIDVVVMAMSAPDDRVAAAVAAVTAGLT